MSTAAWYTRSTWSAADADDFWARIARKRNPAMRAQLIRIQAEHLEKAGQIDAAVALLDQVLTQYPDSFDIAQVHHQLATCRERQGRVVDSMHHLRAALAVENAKPNYKTGAWLTFGRIVAEHRLRELYPEFLAILQSRDDLAPGIVFPVERYLLSASLAIICESRGERTAAVEHARKAIAAAELTRSGLRYHPTVGLVQEKDTPLYASVARIAHDA
jgi:tetratricopeptide (TPR) repeat protein